MRCAVALSRLMATAEVMQLNAALTELAAQRSALVRTVRAPGFNDSLQKLKVGCGIGCQLHHLSSASWGTKSWAGCKAAIPAMDTPPFPNALQGHSDGLSSSISALVVRLEELSNQRDEGEAFRGKKLKV